MPDIGYILYTHELGEEAQDGLLRSKFCNPDHAMAQYKKNISVCTVSEVSYCLTKSVRHLP